MSRSVCLRVCALIACLAAAAPQVARAQHVVTDAEASKLTFDSLIARPHPIPRALPHLMIRRIADEHVVRRPRRVSRLIHVSRLRHSHHGRPRLHQSRG